MSTLKPSPAYPTRADIDRAKIAALKSEPSISDTDRIDALITLFGGHYAFPVMWQVADLFQNGRCGLDAFITSNPSLLPIKKESQP